jgi:hypothetical protein
MFCSFGRFVALSSVFASMLVAATVARAQSAIVAGMDLSGTPGAQIIVPFDPTTAQWDFQSLLLFDPAAPPMTKDFGTPRLPSGAPILLDSLQPFPFLVTEFFGIAGDQPGTPPGHPVSDWHERIVTPGWEWVLPGDARFPVLFPAGTSLITRDGTPWPWEPLPGSGPAEVNVAFPPIDPSHILDIHKALLWVGTDTQRIWGDDPGETAIIVVEYPTPEPSSFVLGALGLAGIAAFKWRKRGRLATRYP